MKVKSLKFTKLKGAVYIVLAVFLVSVPLPVCAATPEKITDGYTTASGDRYDLIKGVFLFPSAVAINNEFKDIPARFFYSDGFFSEDPYKYNAHIATASLCLAMAGFYSNEGATGKDADYSAKSKNIVQYMKDIGVDEKNIYRNVFNMIRPLTDSIGVTIGMKKLSNGRILIPIAIRGSNYEREWTSNVTLGTDGEAKGFAAAADTVFSEIQKYIVSSDLETQTDSGNVDFWISGYSRAGATTNLTAKRLIDKYLADGQKNQVFAYCNEAPMGGVTAAEKNGSDYNCIHSVINRNDIVPRVAPKKMEFKRYGVDHYIPGSVAAAVVDGDDGNKHDNIFYKTSSYEYQTIKTDMLKHLAAVNPNIIFNDEFTPKGLKKLVLIPPVSGDLSKEMDDYLDDFVDNLCEWAGMTRFVYNGGHYITSDRYVVYGHIQTALRHYMEMVFGNPKAETNEFITRLKGLWNNAESLNKWSELIDFVWYALRKWNDPGFKYKAHYTTKVIRWLKDCKCFEALESMTPEEKEKLLNVDMPIIMNFLLTYASYDYWDKNYQYGTNGLAQILTLVSNIKNIGMNHDPEVTLAWLRAQDDLYKNELQTVTVSSVSASSVTVQATEVKIASENASIIVIEEVSDVFVEHGTDYKTQLPTTVKAWDSNGKSFNLSIIWEEPKWYKITNVVSEDCLTEIDSVSDANPAEPLIGKFIGKVNTNGKTLEEGVNNDVELDVYIAGLPRLNVPVSSLPEGEYDGSQTIYLNCDEEGTGSIEYQIGFFADNDDGSSGGGGDLFKKTYTGAIKIGEGVTSTTEYALVAEVKSTNTTSADSEEMIWYYKINPAKTDSGNGEYVEISTSKIFTLSKDIAVCWSIDVNDVKFSSLSVNTDELEITLSPSNSDTKPTKEIFVTVVTKAGKTRRGVYIIPVKTSTDGGKTWNYEESINFDTNEFTNTKQQEQSLNSSGGGCNYGLTMLGIGLVLSVLIMKHKAKVR